MNKKTVAVLGLIGVGIMGRLAPHMPNATPMTAITLAAQKHLGKRWTFAIPLAVLIVSDAFIGFYNWKILISVYGSFALIALMSVLLGARRGVFATLITAAAGSVVFFLVTNFAVWLFSDWYASSIAGLLYCYELGFPFFRSMLIGDICYTFVIMGAFELARMKMPLRNTQLKAALVSIQF